MEFLYTLGLEFEHVALILKRAIMVLLILVITFVFAKVFRSVMNKTYGHKTQFLRFDKTAHTFMKHFVSATIYIIGFSIALYSVPSLRALGVSLFAGAGVLAIILGFASQAAFSNIISGIFISIFKPFRIGDRVGIQGISGIVEDITLRHTVIRTFENIRYVIPNSKISEETIENKDLGDEKIRKFLEFSISYDSDLDLAMKIIEEEVKKHPDYMEAPQEGNVEAKKESMIRLVSFGDSAIVLRAQVWTKNSAAAFRLGSDVRIAVKKRFDSEGVEIPFPHRTIVYKTDVLKERALIGRRVKKKVKKKKG